MKSSSTTWLHLILIAVGAFLLVKVRGIPFPNSNEKSALMCGYLLIGIGAITAILKHEITIIFNQNKRLIRYQKKRFNKVTNRHISYDEIEQFSYRRVGKRYRSPNFYFLVIELKQGDILQTGFYVFSKGKALEKIEELNRKISI